MKVVFVGGGTGGHLAPSLGVAEALREQGAEALFLLAGRAVEHDMLRSRRWPSRALFGAGSRPSPIRLDLWLGAAWRFRRALSEFDPDVLVFTGGWVSLPALLVGAGARPTLLIEPNAVPGKVGRWLSSRVDLTCLGSSEVHLPAGRAARVTGVPTLPLARWSRTRACERLGLDARRRTLLVLGGSQGAADLARLVPGARRVLAADSRGWQVLHLTGRQGGGCAVDEAASVARGIGGTIEATGAREVSEAPGAAVSGGAPDQATDPVPVWRLPFVSEMGAVWAATDLALCRAGSGTVAELCATGTPAVLVPYPHHADRHQEANGLGLVRAGGALCVPREDPSGRRHVPGLLAQALLRLPEMARAAAGLSRPDAAREVARLLNGLVADRGRHWAEAAG